MLVSRIKSTFSTEVSDEVLAMFKGAVKSSKSSAPVFGAKLDKVSPNDRFVLVGYSAKPKLRTNQFGEEIPNQWTGSATYELYNLNTGSTFVYSSYLDMSVIANAEASVKAGKVCTLAFIANAKGQTALAVHSITEPQAPQVEVKTDTKKTAKVTH